MNFFFIITRFRFFYVSTFGNYAISIKNSSFKSSFSSNHIQNTSVLFILSDVKMNTTVAVALTFLTDVSCMLSESDMLSDVYISSLKSFLISQGIPTRATDDADKVKLFRFCAFVSIRAMMELGEIRNYNHSPSTAAAGAMWGKLIGTYRVAPDIVSQITENYRIRDNMIGECVVELPGCVSGNPGTYVSAVRGIEAHGRNTGINEYYYYTNQMAMNFGLPMGIIMAKMKIDQVITSD